MQDLYTPAQWSLIDLANNYGLDKKEFDERLDWGRSLLDDIKSCKGLMDLSSKFTNVIQKADEPELFTASLLNVWDICNGKPTGHYIELDTASSGCQLLSVATRCLVGMENTGAIGDKVPDLYTRIYDWMKQDATVNPNLVRSQVKKATVPYIYGSARVPLMVFGDDMEAFTQSYYRTVKRAEVIKNILIGAWNPIATEYHYPMPDGHNVLIKVIRDYSEVFYFNGQRFTYKYKGIGTKEVGEEGTKCLAARVTHSLDAYVLRETNARCDYNPEALQNALDSINAFLKGESQTSTNLELRNLCQLSKRFEMVSIKGAEYVTRGGMHDIDKDYLINLALIIKQSLKKPPCKLKLIHDGFGALANHVNTLKTRYNHVLGSIYMGVWLFKVIESLTGVDYSSQLDPVDPEVYSQIINNKYAIN
ncbi:MAG: DNA directed RNA polymerase [Podoviridae sp. ctLUJ1]|nr:MAG: DNA directed RNA polymerase [Podoviridae sp. ctLUJ1]